MTDFDEFIKQQAAHAQSQKNEGLTLQQEKQMWLDKLAELYVLVERSLGKYIAEGSIKWSLKAMDLTEEQLGTYTVQEGHITIGRQTVKLEPIGTFLIGARGRLDMNGPKGIARFVIVPPESNAPQVRVSVSIAPTGEIQTQPTEDRVSPPENWVWKIATPPPRVAYIDLNEETFRETLMGVVNG